MMDWTEHRTVDELLFAAADHAMTTDADYTQEQFLAAAQTVWREVQRDHGAELLENCPFTFAHTRHWCHNPRCRDA